MTSEQTLKRKQPDSPPDLVLEAHPKRRATTPEPLRIKRHSKDAILPTRGSACAAGYDLYSAEKKVIPARGKALVDTQISVAVPDGTYGRVAPRSGLASKFGIDTGAGVIDADYRGIVYILLFNLGERDFEVNVGDRIAQLVLERIVTPEVSEVCDLEDTARGKGGFGSTGGHGLLTPASSSPISSLLDLAPLDPSSPGSPSSNPTSPDSTPSNPATPVLTLSVLPQPVLPLPDSTSPDSTSPVSTSPVSTSPASTSSDSTALTSPDSILPVSTSPDSTSPPLTKASPVSTSPVVPPTVLPSSVSTLA